MGLAGWVGVAIAAASPERSVAPPGPSPAAAGDAWGPPPALWPGARPPERASAQLSAALASDAYGFGRASVAAALGPVVVDAWGWSLVGLGAASEEAHLGGYLGARWPLAGRQGRFRAAPFLAAGPGWVGTGPCGACLLSGEDGARAVVLAGIPMRWAFRSAVLDLVAVLPGLELGPSAFFTLPVAEGVGVAFLPALGSEARASFPLGGRAWVGAGVVALGPSAELGWRAGPVALALRGGTVGLLPAGGLTVSWEGGRREPGAGVGGVSPGR